MWYRFTRSAKELSAFSRYNDLKNLDKVERVKVQVGEVATMMRENINSVADMSDRLDDVCSRSGRCMEQHDSSTMYITDRFVFRPAQDAVTRFWKQGGDYRKTSQKQESQGRIVLHSRTAGFGWGLMSGGGNSVAQVAILVAVLACGIIAVAVTIYMSVRTHPAAWRLDDSSVTQAVVEIQTLLVTLGASSGHANHVDTTQQMWIILLDIGYAHFFLSHTLRYGLED
jgi:hypothetical protein